MRHGVAAALEHEPVLKALAFCTVVDVGANRGQFAMAARRCLPSARIISFEPLPQAAARYRRVFAGDGRTTLHVAAVGPQRGEATLHVAAQDDSSSLLPITSTQTTLFPGTYEAETETVKVAPLSDFVMPAEVQPPALLKIDVQGYELMALEGCEDLLAEFAQVYVECSFVELYEGQALAHEVIAWLRERQFSLVGVYHMIYAWRAQAIQGDFLFRRVRSPGASEYSHDVKEPE